MTQEEQIEHYIQVSPSASRQYVYLLRLDLNTDKFYYKFVQIAILKKIISSDLCFLILFCSPHKHDKLIYIKTTNDIYNLVTLVEHFAGREAKQWLKSNKYILETDIKS